MIARIVAWAPGTKAKMAARYGHFPLEEMRSAKDSIGRPEQAPGTQLAAFEAEYPKKSPNSDRIAGRGIQ
jgi:hypothetical protein